MWENGGVKYVVEISIPVLGRLSRQGDVLHTYGPRIGIELSTTYAEPNPQGILAPKPAMELP